MDEDPLFILQPDWLTAPTTVGDLHLQACSPAIDAGTAIGAPITDFDGDVRPNGPGFDMGFDEYTGAPCCTYTVPPNGMATVACPAQAIQPLPPVVISSCGQPVIPTGPVVVNDPNPLTCEGTRRYTWTYDNGFGNLQIWSFTYTIEREPFTVGVPNGSATVACPALAVAPTPPTVRGNCGEVLPPNGPVISNSPNPLTCEGTRTYAYTYTDCEENVAGWSFVYTIEREPFTVQPTGTATVSCPALAVTPTPPTVTSNCGEVLPPNGPVITNSPNPLTCEGTRTYAYTYTDCEGNTATWNFVYTIERQPFTVPANGAATVACPALAVAPTTLPTVTSNCGEVLTPSGPVITNAPNPLTCEGTRTYAYNYTDCEGNTATWRFVYTIERLPFTLPANGSATVACPAQANVQPTPPTVNSNCGEVLTPTVTSSQALGCEGNRVWYFAYTDCEGNSSTWLFTYTVEYPGFSVPPSVAQEFECPINAGTPTPPTIFDGCGRLLNPTGPVITGSQNEQGCEVSRTYTWTYQDCEGNLRTWGVTYNFQYEADFAVPLDEVNHVGCLSHAVPPVPQTLYDICGLPISVSGPEVTELPGGTACSGSMIYTFVYTDCGGHSHPWTFTVHAADNEPPLGKCPNLEIGGLSCEADIPCPDGDFGVVIEQLLKQGAFYDLCSGSDLVVTLDSWSEFSSCNDDDGDGQYTFGRTFYFRIADQCGNEMPELCSVTYSGTCQPISTLPPPAWSQNGDEQTTPVDPATIQQLLDSYGPLVIGAVNASLTFKDANCLAKLMPGKGYPGPLEKCHQMDCEPGCNPHEMAPREHPGGQCHRRPSQPVDECTQERCGHSSSRRAGSWLPAARPGPRSLQRGGMRPSRFRPEQC
ncbi:MAG: hypothetical protein IPN76_30905 [Saprospiraceae bacterium]|nr:hypothetical protein [Saprospiraceae bacterium]